VVFRIHYVAITAPDLDAATATWCAIVPGLRASRSEAETDVDPIAIGLPVEKVRLRGAELAMRDEIGAFLELHQLVEPVGAGARHVCDAVTKRILSHDEVKYRSNA
jgi:catechol 2,3-dioxygenase-like lactoylglutathione lyase family enzyme